MRKQTLAQRAVERYKASKCRNVPQCGTVKCCDCLADGFYEAGYGVSAGWIMVLHGLHPLFLCPSCQKKRREQWKDLLNI